MHVYAWNMYCGEWNDKKLNLLQGKEFTYKAKDNKKDECTQLANGDMLTIIILQLT